MRIKLECKFTATIIRKINIKVIAGEPLVFIHRSLHDYKNQFVVAKYKRYIARRKEIKQKQKEAIYGDDYLWYMDGKQIPAPKVNS